MRPLLNQIKRIDWFVALELAYLSQIPILFDTCSDYVILFPQSKPNKHSFNCRITFYELFGKGNMSK